MGAHHEAAGHSARSATRVMTPSGSLPTAEPRLDAGMKDHDHYAQKLPAWRNALRKRLIWIVRWETPYLALLQEKLRTPALDSYFAYTANLGTHTFFMVMLPVLFWCGYTNIGRAMVNVLALGVFWSGFIKDLLCLPRPLSPPLHRITMSGSAALEYGFPSTHSTNAVSVAVYAIQMLRTSTDQNPTVNMVLQALFYFYALSIVFGRLYCGMHGFFDVVVGSILGAVIATVQLIYGDLLDVWICSGGYLNPLIVTLIILILVRIHPEPADDCPCFDDSVAFSAVLIGCQFGAWHYSLTGYGTDYPIPSTVPFELERMGLVKTCIRIVFGVVLIFLWRGSTKPALFKILPPIFRFLERIQMNLPRAFFLDASQYTSVPALRGDDNIIPSASDIPRMIGNLSHPRKRAISIGPQSVADAYETLAYRNKKRRESLVSADGDRAMSNRSPAIREDRTEHSTDEKSSLSAKEDSPLVAGLLPTPMQSRVHSYELMMGEGGQNHTKTGSPTPPDSSPSLLPNTDFAGEAEEEDREDREIFMKIEKPRVRYDVEVVTKLIVYSGIAWLAVEGNPILFELVGLGMGR
ncbi:PAP2-domain-containing protein [Delitschia confertaspora ATCC 74209]|uniref:PAP2-domain-containing protein n=1 Tax=Delitschia confertaspora ATCC 74209 TaxID=1513339 RepID=A0A9P4MYV6_9PLEO|nr:PAP2-domain-containing protein [Delitschia confertaspora ATCC 74209]